MFDTRAFLVRTIQERLRQRYADSKYLLNK
jgi:hypothetical protein